MSAGRSAAARGSRGGFTLAELVIVIVLISILAGVTGNFIARPLEAYQDSARRATLVDVAESALRRMLRDVRLALPNSLRVDPGGGTFELLQVADGARYRRLPGNNGGGSGNHTSPASPTDWLEFSGDTRWNVLGRLTSLTFTHDVPLAAGHRIAIYTTGASVWSDAATDADPGVITPAATTITLRDDGDEDAIELSASHTFRYESPSQRFYVVEGPVTYQCDTAAGTLTRYAAYTPTAAQPTAPGSPPLASAASARLADRLAACAFRYSPGTSQRAGLLTIELRLSDSGESVRLLQQAHVENVP
jgi:MSHA biogenesis protein MshO